MKEGKRYFRKIMLFEEVDVTLRRERYLSWGLFVREGNIISARGSYIRKSVVIEWGTVLQKGNVR